MASILVAEDEEALRSLLRRGLQEQGHAVTVAGDGAEALDLLCGPDRRFELLLSDIRMPVMDGIALALAVARDHPGLPILLMTGYAEHRERAQGLETLIHGVVTKPFTLAEIRAHVDAALAPRQAVAG
jgi:CheY-like chemotaxis protein